MKNLSITVAGLLALSACATQPEDIQTSYISPLQYQGYNCDQVAMELARVERRASEMQATLKKTANDDEGQMAIGLILFWPALFFLDGSDGPQAQEYARLKGERDALEQTAVAKSCIVKSVQKPTEEEPLPSGS